MQQLRVKLKGQITIPKAVRLALNIEDGDSVTLVVKGDHAILKPEKTKPLSEFIGSFSVTRPFPGSKAIRKKTAYDIGEQLNKRAKS